MEASLSCPVRKAEVSKSDSRGHRGLPTEESCLRQRPALIHFSRSVNTRVAEMCKSQADMNVPPLPHCSHLGLFPACAFLQFYSIVPSECNCPLTDSLWGLSGSCCFLHFLSYLPLGESHRDGFSHPWASWSCGIYSE